MIFVTQTGVTIDLEQSVPMWLKTVSGQAVEVMLLSESDCEKLGPMIADTLKAHVKKQIEATAIPSSKN